VFRCAWVIVVIAIAGCTAPRTVPVRSTADGTFVLVPVTVDGVAATFLFDTGTTHLFVSADFGSRIGLSGKARYLPVAIETATPQPVYDAQFAPIESFKLGPIRARRNPGEVVILDLSNVSLLAGEQIDGLLGNGLWASADYVLNVGEPSLQIVRTLDLFSDPQALPATVSDNRTYLPVAINGKSFEFLLDTGSNFSTVSAELFESLGEIDSEAVELGKVGINAADTKSIKTFREFHAAVTLGQVSASDFVFLVDDKNVIGLDLLRLGELSVSVKQRRFVFR
jgi:predicted aspartyl protease